MSVQSATDRATACVDADTYLTDPDTVANATATAKAAAETHWWNAILNFTNATDTTNPATTLTTRSYPIISQIDAGTLTTWTTTLETAGFTVTQNTRDFTVSLPSP